MWLYRLCFTSPGQKQSDASDIQHPDNAQPNLTDTVIIRTWNDITFIVAWFTIFHFTTILISTHSRRISITYVIIEFIVGIIVHIAYNIRGGHIARYIKETSLQITLISAVLIAYIVQAFIRLPVLGVPVAIVLLILFFRSTVIKKIPIQSAHSVRNALLVLSVSLLFTNTFLISYCGSVFQLGFDDQNYLTWLYASLYGFVPNKDIFYLYGYLTYYADSVFWARIILWMHINILLQLAYFIVQKISRSSWFGFFIVSVLLLFISVLTGFWPFYRYATAPLLTGLFAYAISVTRHKRLLLTGIFGALSGVSWFLLNDQGTIMVAAILALLCVDATISDGHDTKKRISYLLVLLKSLSSYLLGAGIGIMPIVIYLLRKGMLSAFIQYTLITSKIIIYGKISHYTAGWFANDLYVSVALWSAILLLSYNYVFNRHRFRSPRIYVTFVFTCVLGIVQFKNMIRPIDIDTLVPAFFVISSLLATLQYTLRRYNVRTSFICIYGGIILCTYFSAYVTPAHIRTALEGIYNDYTTGWQSVLSDDPLPSKFQRCIDSNRHSLTQSIDATRLDVLTWLTSRPDFDRRVFSFPGDPIFYVHLGQIPPRFLMPMTQLLKPPNSWISDISETTIFNM